VPTSGRLSVGLRPEDVREKFDKSEWDEYDDDDDDVDGGELKFRCSSALGDGAPPPLANSADEIAACEPLLWRREAAHHPVSPPQPPRDRRHNEELTDLESPERPVDRVTRKEEESDAVVNEKIVTPVDGQQDDGRRQPDTRPAIDVTHPSGSDGNRSCKTSSGFFCKLISKTSLFC